MGSLQLTFLSLLSLYYVLKLSNNNSCTNYLSYLNIHYSPHCYHDPDIEGNITQVIFHNTGLFETHQVSTEDGYLLTIFRIPKKNPRGVILLQHPVAFDATFFMAQSNDSIALKFWQAGYDVWMGNNRGTFYSKSHATIHRSDPSFWNYSFHEIGYYDNHAIIEYVKKASGGGKIVYIGVSLGATAGIVYTSTRAEAVENLEIMIAVAPGVTLIHVTSWLGYLKPLMTLSQPFFDNAGHIAIFRYDSWPLQVWRYFHYYFPLKKYLVYLMKPIMGWTSEFNPRYSNNFAAHMGSEISLKVFYHYYQMYEPDAQFKMYNYGTQKNLIVYGNAMPPLYQLDKIKVPVFLINSVDDSLSTKEDCDLLYQNLPESVRYGRVVIHGMNHLDFGFGNHKMKATYDKILKLLNRIYINNTIRES